MADGGPGELVGQVLGLCAEAGLVEAGGGGPAGRRNHARGVGLEPREPKLRDAEVRLGIVSGF